MLLVVCGNVQSGQVLQEVGKQFGGLENRGRFGPAEPWELRETGPGPQLHIESGPWKKVHLSVGLPMPGILSGSEQAIEVLAQMLGGDKTSRFYRKFKYDSKLVDEISVSPLLLERGGMLYLNAQLDPDRLEPFWSELLQELASLEASVFTDEELGRAKLNIEDSLFQTKETLSGLASKLGYFQFYENGVQAVQRYLHHLRRVDRSELQDVIDTHFSPSKLCVSMVLPEALPREGDIFLKKIPELWPEEAAAQEGPAAETATGQPELFDLGGGGSLALIPDDTLPYTALTLTWPGGDLLLGEDQAGLAALAARGLSRGVPDMDAPAVREFLADRT
ncbi:MAG: M16 family metallopeptidase, partial [Desulfovibrionales bacterium]